MTARLTGVQGRMLITESCGSQAMALYDAAVALETLEQKAEADGTVPPTVVAIGWQVDFAEDGSNDLVYTALIALEEG